MSALPVSAAANAKNASPWASGFAMPAEWEPQDAVWLSWPHKASTWPGAFKSIPSVFAAIAAHISVREKVRINLPLDSQKKALALIKAAGAEMANVEFYDNPTNDAWCRDHGPIFVSNSRTREIAVTDWEYNSWGGKYPPFDKDNQIPKRVAQDLGMRRFTSSMVLEGGSIDVNGTGLVLTTEACLLNPNRNPGMSRNEIEHGLRDFLGTNEVIWLGKGIAGDDTDGHVDDLARFFREYGIVTCVEKVRSDVNYAPLRDNLERLKELRTPGGNKYRIAELPMPAPVLHKGTRLPASYANFLIINGAVLMPAFRQPKKDREAAEVLASCFPEREVIAIDCLELVWGLGTLHCISQQQPSPAPAE
ncbi:MAG TPA: agmatine deiminase family protein [Opitutaceae bacterium]|nr:agmatine deiminase family protein [Opitutaceae bacterium]